MRQLDFWHEKARALVRGRSLRRANRRLKRVEGLIPCNAVSHCFEVLCRAYWLAFSSIPQPTSVVNWEARARLGRFLSVRKMRAPWVAIIDSSISYGKAKMLVVILVPLAHFAQGNGAAGLADTECVSLAVRESWTGEGVKDQLLRTSMRPAYQRQLSRPGRRPQARH